MADTNYGVNHPLAVKAWAKSLMQEALKSTYINKFVGEDSNSLIYVKDEIGGKQAGDRVTVGLRMQLSGAGVQGDSTLEGNEEALTTYSDNLLINQLRHAVKSGGKMSEQRVHFSVRKEARDGLGDWFADRMDTSFFNQITGNTGQSDTKYTGNNSTIAPDSSHILYPDDDASEANVASGSASSIFNLTLIDKCVERAKTISPLIRPIMVNGEKKYVMFLHPYQVKSLRTNTSTGQWLDIQKAALQGGLGSKSPIYTGALGEYNGVVLHESTRIPRTTVSADATATDLAGVYRSVFCGAQSALIAYNSMSPKWVEKLFDYDNQLGVSGSLVWGLKKTVYNSADFGTIVVPTFAKAG